jgi:hypothetical protein
VYPPDPLARANVKDTNAALVANDDPILVHEADCHGAADRNGDRVPQHVATVARPASRSLSIRAEIGQRSTGPHAGFRFCMICGYGQPAAALSASLELRYFAFRLKISFYLLLRPEVILSAAR